MYSMNKSWIMNGQYHTKLEIPAKWKALFESVDFSSVENKILLELETHNVFPRRECVLKAFELTSPETLRVVILGQDPYIKEDQATGLAFSVAENSIVPPSLKNILQKTTNPACKSGDLSSWAMQGVLLLNTALTVNEKKSNSHKNIWKSTIEKIISIISNQFSGIVFILWGANALSKKKFIEESKHHVLVSSHPSPLGCCKTMQGYEPFNKCDHFSECNRLLKATIEF